MAVVVVIGGVLGVVVCLLVGWYVCLLFVVDAEASLDNYNFPVDG